MPTGDKELDSQINELLDELTDSTMSNYEKVLAIYKYIETNYSYSSSFIPSENDYVSEYDAKMIGRAKGIFTTGHGTCTEFSAAFMVMMRTLGFDCYCVEGRFAGGRHTWTVMVLDGNKYIFDPQIDFRQWQRKKTICLTRFCMDDSFDNYSKYRATNEERNINSFSNFEIKK